MPKEDNLTSQKLITSLKFKEAVRQIFFFKKYLRRCLGLEWLLLFLGICSQLSSLLSPYLGKIILDRGVLGRNSGVFFTYSIITGIIYIITLIFENAENYFKKYTALKIQADLANDAFKRLRYFSLDYFYRQDNRDFFALLDRDITSAAESVAVSLPKLAAQALKMLAIAGIMLAIDYRVIIVVIGYQFILTILNKFFSLQKADALTEGLKKGRNNPLLNNIYSHIYFLKASGNLFYLIRLYFSGLINRIRLEISSERRGAAISVFSGISNRALFSLIGMVGMFLVIKGKLTLGTTGAIIAYLSQASAAYNAITVSRRKILDNHAVLKKVSEVMRVPLDLPEKKDARMAVFSGGSIEFKEVSFGYAEGKYIIEGLNFYIPPAAKVALVGSSGKGKTTIINLILRLYDPKQGAILIDGNDLRDLRFKSLYSQTGVALQEPFLFNDLIFNNISLGNNKYTRADLASAAKIADIHDFIDSLEHDYGTVIGENAYKVSQGQKQRIAIARAVIKRPKILILDEAMSSLDSQTEDRIIENIRREFAHSTVIVVSHRLSSAKKMDAVYFLKNNSQIEVGTHDELVLRSREYNELFASQIEAAGQSQGVQAIEGAGY
jgi:ABC-type multidrug transport system fused ATPase/permease subunit